MKTVAVRRSLSQALDLVLPPVCLGCRAAVDRQGDLCPACWREITFLTPPWCYCCGRPFDYDAAGIGQGEELACGDCARRRPIYDRARAAMIYDDASRDLILKFKHADRTEAAPALATWMNRVAEPLIEGADLVAAVPLHRWRLLRRRYNQAALLAARLCQTRSAIFAPDLLRRVKATPSQGGMDRAGRVRNVRGAFSIRDRYRARLAGARVLLVDDVMTTGATVEACARTLLRAGAGAVDVVTLARVVRAEV